IVIFYILSLKMSGPRVKTVLMLVLVVGLILHAEAHPMEENGRMKRQVGRRRPFGRPPPGRPFERPPPGRPPFGRPPPFGGPPFGGPPFGGIGGVIGALTG
ncbi:unnamed protein product, partial [Meganyctiphanes norvegica]